MFYKLEVTNSQGDILALPLEEVNNGLYIMDIEGLGPVKATLVSTSFARLDGQQYQSAKREPRNIVLKLELDPDPAVEEVRVLRNRIYEYFMPKTQILMQFFDDVASTVQIQGYIETCEPSIFTDKPGVEISIMCFAPDFLALTETTVTGNTTSSTTEQTLAYSGTVETGIKFQLNLNRTLSAFTIYQRTPSDEIRSLDFSASLLSGDVVEISTVRGNKYADLIRSGVRSSILYGVSPQSNWMELVKGDNNIRVYATGAAIPWQIVYTSRYGGL